MKPELVVVVDKNDNVLKTIDRASAAKSDIIRVTGVFIINEKNEIMLQLRSPKRDRYPIHWDCSAGGHTDPGEDYAACAHRELYEETGIRTDLVLLGKHYIELDDGRRHFITFFKGKYRGDFKIDPKEVAKIKFFSTDEISKMINNKEKFHPECVFGLEKYFLK